MELWAVHTLGMDDVHPCASRRLAIRNATWMNLSLVVTDTVARYDDTNMPFLYHVPVLWDGDPESHAMALRFENNEDPRWSDPEADVVWELAEGMLRSRRDADESAARGRRARQTPAPRGAAGPSTISARETSSESASGSANARGSDGPGHDGNNQGSGTHGS